MDANRPETLSLRAGSGYHANGDLPMRSMALAAFLAMALLAGLVVAQGGSGAGRDGPHDRQPASGVSAGPPDGPTSGSPRDASSFPPDPNQAHRGGGVILEGAPGAPPPSPQPTPPLPQSRTIPTPR